MRKFFRIAAILILSVLLFLITGLQAVAAPLTNVPQQITQPDGTVVNCFTSGDEYFHYLHDENGILLMLNDAGYVVYAGVDDEGLPVTTGNTYTNKSTDCPKITVSDIDAKKVAEQSIYFKGLPEKPADEETTPVKQMTEIQKQAFTINNTAKQITDIEKTAVEQETPLQKQTFSAKEIEKKTNDGETKKECDPLLYTLTVVLILVVFGLVLFYFLKGKRKILSIILAIALFAGVSGTTYKASAEELGYINGVMSNLVIYIYFSDETSAVLSQNLSTYNNSMNGPNNSVLDYYQTLSGGRFSLNSIPAKNSDNSVFIYQDTYSRNYYKVKTDTNIIGYQDTDQERALREKGLLTRALTAAKEKFSSVSGSSMDLDLDGYADSVTFVLNGSPEGWSDMLWPHMWSMGGLNYFSGTGGSVIINNKTIDLFNFQFAGRLTTGVLCHELSHVLGAPDLYDYNYQYDYVGSWDLMAQTSNVPQYMLAYMRQKYFGWVGDNQISNLISSGSYTLSDVTEVTPLSGTPMALCFETGISNEKIYIEYRDRASSGGEYDSSLSGSGLIVYRVRNDADGNYYARPRGQMGVDLPEVYIYRPLVYTAYGEKYVEGGTFYQRTGQDIDKAWLSPQNSYFNEFGKNTTSLPFDSETVYLTNGNNSGLFISNIIKNTDGTVTFHIGINNNDPMIYTQNAKYSFTQNMAYMIRNNGSVLQLCASDNRIFSDEINYWINVKDISSGDYHLAALKNDGTVEMKVFADEFGYYYGQNYGMEEFTDIKKIQSAAYHTIALKNNGTVVSSGTDPCGRDTTENYTGFSEWTDIKDIGAAYDFTVGVKNDGTVVIAGEYASHNIDVSGWQNIKSVAVSDLSVLGIRNDGTVVSTGVLDFPVPKTITNITDAVAQTYRIQKDTEWTTFESYFFLRDDGTVILFDGSSGTVEKSAVTNAVDIMNSLGFITAILENGDPVYLTYYFESGPYFEQANYIKNGDIARIAVAEGTSGGLSSNQFNVDTKLYPLGAVDQSVDFSSSNTAVADVNDAGIVTFYTPGEVIITGSVQNGLSSACKLNYDGTKVEKLIYSAAFPVNSAKGYLYADGGLTLYQLSTKVGFGLDLSFTGDDFSPAATSLTLSFAGDAKNALTLIARGDINCDGEVTVLDYIALKNSILSKVLLSGVFREASDLNLDENTDSILDILSVKDIILG